MNQTHQRNSTNTIIWKIRSIFKEDLYGCSQINERTQLQEGYVGV